MEGSEVMLASSEADTPNLVVARLQKAGWWFEIKFDGIRAVVTRTAAGLVRIHNRRRIDITHRYPDVVAQVSGYGFVGTVDGEIIVPDERGRPIFHLAHLRDAQASDRGVKAAMLKAPAVFMPFDAVEENGFDLREFSYLQRRARLATMVPAGATSVSSREGAAMWRFVTDNDMEGLIAKRPSSQYRLGRSKAWIKIKLTKRISALVCGMTDPKGSRAEIGALKLCLWNPSTKELVAIGNVGSGFTDDNLRWAKTQLDQNATIVAEVEYLSVSETGKLRMPVFKAFRTDMDPEACTTAQLA